MDRAKGRMPRCNRVSNPLEPTNQTDWSQLVRGGPVRPPGLLIARQEMHTLCMLDQGRCNLQPGFSSTYLVITTLLKPEIACNSAIFNLYPQERFIAQLANHDWIEHFSRPHWRWDQAAERQATAVSPRVESRESSWLHCLSFHYASLPIADRDGMTAGPT